jgi:hypothetical protein
MRKDAKNNNKAAQYTAAVTASSWDVKPKSVLLGVNISMVPQYGTTYANLMKMTANLVTS